jgi:hypothetical protein
MDAKFRVDPKEIRVSIGRTANNEWKAKFVNRFTGEWTTAVNKDPLEALKEGLHRAYCGGIPGTDIHMARFYKHPQHKD